MSLINRLICCSIVFMVSILISSGIPNQALADDCVQKRKTPNAAENILKKANPLEATPDNIAAGKSIYQRGAKPLACAQCHGTNGNGKGTMANGMNPKPRDFTCQAMMKDIPDGQLYWIIKNGSKGTGMMGFKTLKDEQIWQVVSYIRQFVK
jgi:mono/diheme cytochrome c family protein